MPVPSKGGNTIGILICGLNGCGKSTVGNALAKALGLHFIDIEHLYFSRNSASDPYRHPNSRQEVERLLLEEIRAQGDFVLAAVKGDYGEAIIPLYRCVVLLDVPRALRLQRVRHRSLQKFGSRMLPGGDLHEQEEAFFRLVEARRDDYVEQWVQTLTCPVIRVDGTQPVEKIVACILHQL